MYRILSIFAFFLCVSSCRNAEKIHITGDAQGTTYSIAYYSPSNENLKHEVDSVLLVFDYSLSTYNPLSLVSRLNNNEELQTDLFFNRVFSKSIEISELTEGAFDVTGGPVFNAWGFGHTPKAKVDSSAIQELLRLIGYGKARIDGDMLMKDDPGVMLNFNAIAQGFSVDVIAEFLEARGIGDYLIEIGGEVRASGQKKKGELWKVGIDKPEAGIKERELKAILSLKNKSLATSGNYRKFYEEDGQRYSHTIDPRTGYPTRNNLLSATVIASDCMTADAFATAFMVMGLEKSMEFLNSDKNPGLEVFFIYSEEGKMKTFISKGLEKDLEEL